MADSNTGTPAHKDYWEDFYADGPGKQQYEWYDLDVGDLGNHLLELINSNQHSTSPIEILQIGVGNSLLLNQLLEDPLYPQDKLINITNIDISELAIQWMKDYLAKTAPNKYNTTSTTSTKNNPGRKDRKKDKFLSKEQTKSVDEEIAEDTPDLICGNTKLYYKIMDACAMGFR